MNYKISCMYFSPTGTTKKIVDGIAFRIEEKNKDKIKVNCIDFTLKSVREETVQFGVDDILIIGVPVYAGRVPNVLLNYLNTIIGCKSYAIPIVVYGNRNYDDALIELKNILINNGFKVISAGAFIGEHSFSDTLAKGRPDEKDMEIVYEFADNIVKLFNEFPSENISVKGQTPLRSYFQPKDRDGNPFDFKRIIPKTNKNCMNCKLCSEICPMESIDNDNVSKLNGPCIKCCACIKSCPVHAKYFDDVNYLKHKEELEIDCEKRREIEIFM
ncbi:MAG: 4Fe-4S ferredoxin, iron-sulfur binding domain protein [Bacillota bacterium]|nr:4Fe-4S ferredoxin, iron-sulfur binding domain protein [Bacillota bacterium]